MTPDLSPAALERLVERLAEPLTVHLSVTGMELGTAHAVRRMMVERAEAASVIEALAAARAAEPTEAEVDAATEAFHHWRGQHPYKSLQFVLRHALRAAYARSTLTQEPHP